jgi:serine/threonine-protein kinase
MNDRPSLIGAAIGNYRIVSPLGEGGMGAVYLGEHPLIGKRVALKVLHSEFASNGDVVARFFNEARAVNEIGHPNIVDVLDFGHIPSDPPFVYLIMEYLDGWSLAASLQAHGAFEPARALHVAQQIADALAASHAHGIVHRDLKPDNVFLLSKGQHRDFVKVLDFGIAKLSSSGRVSSRTRTGVVMGTPAYMSPEQCEGRSDVDGRTDVYALGVLLFEMLTGRLPFVAQGFGEMLVQHLTVPAPRVSSIDPRIPGAVCAIVARALEKAPERRFSSMAEMVAALRDPVAFEAGVPLAAPVEQLPAWQIPQESGSAKRPTTLGTSVGERPVSLHGARKSRRALVIGLLSAAAAAAIGVAVHVATDHEIASAPTPTPEPAPAPAPAPAPVPPIPAPLVPQVVTLTVSAAAPDARVFLDGVPQGAANTPIVLLPSETPVTVLVRATNYQDWTMSVTPRRDLQIEAALVPEAKPELKPYSDPHPRPHPHPHPQQPQSQPQDTCANSDPDCLLAPRFH